MMADALMKRGESRLSPQKFLKTWTWAIACGPSFTSAKKNKKS